MLATINMKKLIHQIKFLLIIWSLFICACINNQAPKESNQETNTPNYLVTATGCQSCVDQAMEILKEGGTAADAVLSSALSAIAYSGGKYVSYAGVMNLIYFEAESGKVYNMNAGFNTVQNEKSPLSIPYRYIAFPLDSNQQVTIGRAILVPGFIKGVEEAHKKFGKIPFQNLFEHAISISENGKVWSKIDSNRFSFNKEIITYFQESEDIFTKEDGTFYQVGDTFKQSALAQTLKKISLEGADYIYKGAWGKKFVKVAQEAGSKIILKDLQDYEVIWAEPSCVNYEGYTVYSTGEPGYGGITLLEALNFAKVSGFSRMEHYSKSPETLAMLYKIAKASYTSTYAPRYILRSIDISPKSRLKLNISKKIWETLYGKDSDQIKRPFRSEHSDAIVAIDKFGNMAALIHSINTVDWGTTGIFIDGISIPDPASFQQTQINKAGLGQRLPDGTNPGIVLKNGKPVLGFSCIGEGLQNQTFINVFNVLSFNMSPKEAINSPSIGTISGALHIEPGQFSAPFLKSARRLGGYFTENERVISGFWSGIYCRPNGKLESTDVWLK